MKDYHLANVRLAKDEMHNCMKPVREKRTLCGLPVPAETDVELVSLTKSVICPGCFEVYEDQPVSGHRHHIVKVGAK